MWTFLIYDIINVEPDKIAFLKQHERLIQNNQIRSTKYTSCGSREQITK